MAGESDGNFALVRYNTNGSLDTTFSGDGKLTTETGSGFDVIVQADGKILVAGDSSNRFAVVRYNTDGSLDTTFGNAGRVTIDIGAYRDTARSAVLQADGKILVAGGSSDTSSVLGYDFSLVRLNTNGSLDTSFSGDGKVTTAFGTVYTDVCGDMAVQADGKILLVGTSDGIQALVRYNPDGSLDTSFDDDGRVKTAGFDAAAMGLQPDGKILVAGRTGTYPSPDDFSLVRYNSNGSLDTTFGNAGAVKTDLGSTIEGVSDIVVQPDGKILVVGYTIVVSSSRWEYALVRYNIDGSLDTSFSGDGKVTIAVGPTGNSGVLESVKLQADGKILVAGSSGSSGKMDFTVVRLNTDGSVDITFDAGIDTTAPTVTTFSPADEAANISIRSNIYVTFNEAINKGAGNIVLKTAAGATVATYDAATSTNLSISGSTLTINPTADLSYGTGYKVEFAAGTIKDLSGNSYAGTASYNFTTGTTDKGSESKDLVFVFKSEKVGAGVNPASYSYFYTVNPDEAAFVRAQANWPWVEKTASFEAAHSNPSDSVSVFRFWSDKHQSHFFTINAAEKTQIIDWSSTGTNGYDWKYEGENFKVYTSATPTDALGKAAIPVYRVWMDDKDFNAANGVSGGHYFTANKVDYDAMVKLVGVVGEGVAFYGEVPGA